MGIADRKRELRTAVRVAGRAFDDTRRRAASERIWKRVERLPEFVSAGSVALYWSLPDEVFTHDFVRKWAGEKQVLLPAICAREGSDAGDLIFRQFDPVEQLVQGRFGIPECCGDEFPPDAIDLIVVPGVAFDRAGRRLGRGKGFYDRFFAEAAGRDKIFKVGVCFGYQLFDEIPAEPHDIQMDLVIFD